MNIVTNIISVPRGNLLRNKLPLECTTNKSQTAEQLQHKVVVCVLFIFKQTFPIYHSYLSDQFIPRFQLMLFILL